MKLPSPRELWSDPPEKVRDFGKALAVVLLIFGALAARRAHALAAAEPHALVAWIVLTLSNAFPAAARPLYVGLSMVGMSIGFVLGHAVLALLFFTLFVVIGRMRRATSPVELGFDKAAASYWKPHAKVKDRSRYYRQY